MKLSERKRTILAAIVEAYIRSGEPVGSKFLAESIGLNVSPATIRADMAWLFEMGYLEQPHTSAGRIPSHLGYREYIDAIMNCRPLTKEEKDEIDSLFNVRYPDPDRLLEDAADAISEYTGCAAVASSVTPKTVRVSRIELVAAGINTVVVLLITTSGIVRNKVCRVDFAVTPELLEFFYKFANSRLAGKSVESISSSYISSVSVTLGEYSRIFTPIMMAIFELCKEIDEGQYYLRGGSKLLNYKEASPAGELLRLLENPRQLESLFDTGLHQIKITIGKENSSMELSGSSVVVSRYQVGGENAGSVALIGPVRLDYAKVIPHLNYFSKTLGELLSETYSEGG